MRKELSIVGSISISYGPRLPFEEQKAQFARLEFCTDMTTDGSLVFPCGALMVLAVKDGIVVAAIARSSISVDELSFVNRGTWGDLFAGGSCTSFFANLLQTAAEKLAEKDKRHPEKDVISRACAPYTWHSALRAASYEEIPRRILNLSGLGRLYMLKTVECVPHVPALLEYVAEDPFFQEYKYPS